MASKASSSLPSLPALLAVSPDWTQQAHRVLYFDWLGEQLCIRSYDDWYKVKAQTVWAHHGRTLLASYKDSLFLALKCTYSGFPWLPWKFLRLYRGFWQEVENQRWYLSWLASELGFCKMRDWYNAAISKMYDFSKRLFTAFRQGEKLINKYYNGCVYLALKAVFPEANWIPWCFKNQPKGLYITNDRSQFTGLWASEENRVLYLKWLGSKLVTIVVIPISN